MTRPVDLREQSRLEVMRRIRAAAVDLLAEKAFHEVTTREVADRAGIGEATLFRHVESKQALLTLAFGDRMDSMLDAVEEHDRRAASTHRGTGKHYYERVLDVFRARADFYRQNPENATLYMRLGFDLRNATLARNLAQGDRIIRLVTAIVADGQAAGVLSDAVAADSVALNCHGLFIHEVDRTPVRGLDPVTITERVETRLSTQLAPLVTDGSLPSRRRRKTKATEQ